MDLEITPRNYSPSKRVESHVEKYAEKFPKYVHELLRVRFTLLGEKHEHICEVHIHANGKDYHTKGSHEDMLVAVDKAAGSMEEQLRRDKAKRVDQKTRGVSAAALEASLEVEEDPGDTITGDEES